MKKISALIALLLVMGIASVSNSAPALSFYIDFGQDGSYETGSTILLDPGDSIFADIYVSGLNEAGNGLAGWAFSLDYGDNLTAVSAIRNMQLWPLVLSQDVLTPDLKIEGLPLFGTGVEGDNLLLFSVELKCTGPGPNDLFLWDRDKGGVSADVVALLGDNLDGQFEGGVYLGSVNNVPLPGAAWLLGSGLIGLASLRRRKY